MFFSYQDTCVALQALAAYSEKTGGDQMDLRIEVSNNEKFKETLMVTQKNTLVQQQLDVSSNAPDGKDSNLFLEPFKAYTRKCK